MQARQFCAILLAGCVGGVALPAGTAAAAQARPRTQDNRQQQMRFQDMDRDGDGVITRAEWRGNLQSFRQHDRNNDGVLSGDEVWTGSPDASSGAQGLAAVFLRADRDNDRQLSRDEWYGDIATFERVDRDDDGRISLSEFLGEDVEGTSGTRERFETLDRNDNGVLTSNEWTGSLGEFHALDADNDGVLTRAEYARQQGVGTEPMERRSEAYRAGYNRGLSDGRQAGSEDRKANRGWDLEGQRELETADAGYSSQLG